MELTSLNERRIRKSDRKRNRKADAHLQFKSLVSKNAFLLSISTPPSLRAPATTSFTNPIIELFPPPLHRKASSCHRDVVCPFFPPFYSRGGKARHISLGRKPRDKPRITVKTKIKWTDLESFFLVHRKRMMSRGWVKPRPSQRGRG